MKNENKNTSRPKAYRRSYFGPILLIAIGLVFLGKNIGLIPGEGWGTIWRLWPLLLIIGGLDDLFRREGVAWPIMMIAAGVLLLYNYFGPQSWISWTQILQLWPILLIAVGIDVIFRGQSGWKSLLGVLLSIVLLGAAVLLAIQGVETQADRIQIEERYAVDVESAELDLTLSVGELLLGSGSQTGRLITGTVTPGNVLDDLEEKGSHLVYGLESTRPAFFPSTARWDLKLASGIPLEVRVDNSVGEIIFDSNSLELDSLFANQGVGRMFIGLPDNASEDVLIKQGVGVIEIEIPEDIRIAVDAQNGLTWVDFPDDFELDDGYYATPGATKNNAELFIVVEQGVGLVTFKYAK